MRRSEKQAMCCRIQGKYRRSGRLFVALERTKCKANRQRQRRYADPAKAQLVQRQPFERRTDKAERKPGGVQGVKYADAGRAGGGQRIRIGIALSKPMAQTHQNQHDGNRIDGVEDGHRDAQDGIEPQVAGQEGYARNCKHPDAIGNLFE